MYNKLLVIIGSFCRCFTWRDYKERDRETARASSRLLLSAKSIGSDYKYEMCGYFSKLEKKGDRTKEIPSLNVV